LPENDVLDQTSWTHPQIENLIEAVKGSDLLEEYSKFYKYGKTRKSAWSRPWYRYK